MAALALDISNLLMNIKSRFSSGNPSLEIFNDTNRIPSPS